MAGGAGLALIYAALDQGNRLDWLNSGLVWGLMSAGALLLAAFLIHEARTPRPLLNLKLVFGVPMPSSIPPDRVPATDDYFATAYLIPLFLGSVRGFRDLEVGETLDLDRRAAAHSLSARRVDAAPIGREAGDLDRIHLHQRRLSHGGL